MRLAELREERNLTQNDIAIAIQTSRTNIGRWEKGLNEPTASCLVKLADFFDVSVDYLLGRTDDFGNIAVQPANTQFTTDERQLIEDYRALSPALQKMLRATIETWKGSDVNESKKRRDTQPRRA